MFGNAVLFDGTNDYYIENDTAWSPSAAPFTMAASGKLRTASTGPGCLMSLHRGNSNNHYYSLNLNAAAGSVRNVEAVSRAGGGATQINRIITDGHLDDQWGYYGFSLDASDNYAVWGSASASAELTGTDSTPSYPTNIDSVTVGARKTGTEQLFDGDLGYAALWGVALNAGERNALKLGAHPITIRPDQLLFCMVWVGTQFIDLLDTATWTDNTVGLTKGTDAQIIMPQGQIIVPAAAGGVSNDIAASLQITASSTLDLDGAGELDSALSVAITAALNLNATGELSSTLASALSIAADLEAIGDIDAALSVAMTAVATLSALGNVAAAMPITASINADIQPSSTDDISAALLLSVASAADLNAPGTLASALAVSMTLAAGLNATGDMNPLSQVDSFLMLSDLSAAGELRAVLPLALSVAADIRAPGELRAAAGVVISTVFALADANATDAASAVQLLIEALDDNIIAAPGERYMMAGDTIGPLSVTKH